VVLLEVGTLPKLVLLIKTDNMVEVMVTVEIRATAKISDVVEVVLLKHVTMSKWGYAIDIGGVAIVEIDTKVRTVGPRASVKDIWNSHQRNQERSGSSIRLRQEREEFF
jgi:hypothetical protein